MRRALLPPSGPGHLLVGLGNPGPAYAATRHNLGYAVADRLAHRWQAGAWQREDAKLTTTVRVAGAVVLLVKPVTFMNRSGDAVGPLVAQTGLELGRVVVVHDDLDLPFGRLRIRLRGGHGGHNGVRSVIEALASREFVRLRLGIGRPAEADNVVDHVLSRFSSNEESVLSDFLERAADAAESIIVEGPERAMNLFPS